MSQRLWINDGRVFVVDGGTRFEATITRFLELEPDFTYVNDAAEFWTPEQHYIVQDGNQKPAPNTLSDRAQYPPKIANYQAAAVPVVEESLEAISGWTGPNLPHPIGSAVHVPYPVPLTDGLYTDASGWYWFVPNGNSLGSPDSGSDVATDVVLDLYKTLWPILNAAPPGWLIRNFEGGAASPGPSAQADWDNNKRILIPDMRGRGILSAGHGAGLTSRLVGAVGGAETHALTADENGPHDHPMARQNTSLLVESMPTGFKNLYDPTAHGYNLATQSSGSGAPHNNMSPWKAYHELWFTGVRSQ